MSKQMYKQWKGRIVQYWTEGGLYSDTRGEGRTMVDGMEGW